MWVVTPTGVILPKDWEPPDSIESIFLTARALWGRDPNGGHITQRLGTLRFNRFFNCKSCMGRDPNGGHVTQRLGTLSISWIRFVLFFFEVPPRIVPFEFSHGDDAITSGEPLTVQCGVSEGDMPVTFRWTFHGKELSSQMGIATVRLNSRVSLLSIDSIAAGHAGDYTCTAQNSAGQVNHTAVLLVQGVFFSMKIAIEVALFTFCGVSPLRRSEGFTTRFPV